MNDENLLQKDALLCWQEMTGCQTPHEAKEKIQKLIYTSFLILKEIWIKETAHHSSINKLTNHSAYNAIIEMGRDVVPFIISDLEKEPNHWGPALRQITGANPVPIEHAGKIKEIAKDWIEWYRTFNTSSKYTDKNYNSI